MSINTKELIKKYFNSLVQEFITDPNHQDITIVFENRIDSEDVLGKTQHKISNKVHSYTITFLNHYEDEELWRGTVTHEFAHLYLFSKEKWFHKHDDELYSKMDYFEDWLDKHYRLSPRKNKGYDWIQHVDPNRREQRENQYSTPTSWKVLNRLKEKVDWVGLIQKLAGAETLTDLENVYQTVKNSSLYDSDKKTWADKDKEKNNKEKLDSLYDDCRKNFCENCLSRPHKTNCTRCYDCRKYYWRTGDLLGYCSQCNQEWANKAEEQTQSDHTRERGEQFEILFASLERSKNLTELESNYQKTEESCPQNDSKKRDLDRLYQKLKEQFREEEKESIRRRQEEERKENGDNAGGLIFFGFAAIFITTIVILFVRSKRKRY